MNKKILFLAIALLIGASFWADVRFVAAETTPALTVTKYSGFGGTTVVAGNSNVKLGSFVVSENTTDAVTVNSITVFLDTAEYSSSVIKDIYLRDEDNNIWLSDNKFNLSNTNILPVNFTLSRFGSKVIGLYGEISANANLGAWQASVSTDGIVVNTGEPISAGPIGLQTINIQSSTIQPSITSISPTSGPVGTTVIIYGKNLQVKNMGDSYNVGEEDIYFGDKKFDRTFEPRIDVALWQDDKIVIRIPKGAETGKIRVVQTWFFNYNMPNTYAKTVDVYGPVFTVTATQPSISPPDLQIMNFKYYPTADEQNNVDTQIEFDLANTGDNQAGFYMTAWDETTNFPLKTEQYNLSPGQSVHVSLMNVNNINRLTAGYNKISLRLVSLDSRVVYLVGDYNVARQPAGGATGTVTIPTISPAQQISDINEKSNLLSNDQFAQVLAELKQLRNTVEEQRNEIKYLKSLVQGVKELSEKAQDAINNFITYGVDTNTQKLGAGERAAVMNSYKAAFGKLPETEAELADAIKIANGRFPSVTSDQAETQATAQFVKIYKRQPDLNNANDNAAIKVMAYGLRQKAENRSLNSEKTGIKIFKSIFGKTPQTTQDWNTMQAITYSGATR